MIDLAMDKTGNPISIKSISDREGLSNNYLEQIFATLKLHGLVHSIRGAQGGYVLAKSPEEISIGDILRALEGDFKTVECLTDDVDNICEKYNSCITRTLWEKIEHKITQVIDSTTLQDIINEHNNK